MDPALAKGYARQLIDSTRPQRTFNARMMGGTADRMLQQYVKTAYSKKSTLVAQKMFKASGQLLKPRITKWERNHTSLVMDAVSGAHNFKVYDPADPERQIFKESCLVMFSTYLQRNFDDFDMFHIAGPTMGLHAIARLLHRKAATPQDVKKVAYLALSRARDAVALLRGETEPYDLLLPFAKGALVVHVHGFHDRQNYETMPLLSVRTYLTDKMLSEAAYGRTLDLAAFYLDQDYSNTDRYLELLLENRRLPNEAAHEEIIEDLAA